ncbi:mucin-2-like [Branchiostoma floridae]|uniref:Mucin-2-like n=1 Tax=Branchiostoma floridae TaxID=7739 RepID=A0A9J7N4S9_BRAFL|nr:mucin-2-like [Branchiostoma floridae]
MFVARLCYLLRILLLLVEVTLSEACIQHSRVTHSEVYNGICYTFGNVRENFNTYVNTDCAAVGGTPALITNNDIQTFLSETISGNAALNTSTFWIGLEYMDNEQRWAYTDQARTSLPGGYNEWAKGEEPENAAPPKTCVLLLPERGHRWGIRDCGKPKLGLCQIPVPSPSPSSSALAHTASTTLPQPVATFPPGCAPNPELAASAEYNGICYIFSARPTDYRTYLLTDCPKFGATPVLVTNNQIHQFLVSQLKQYPQFDGKHFWIGLIHHPDHDHWIYAEESLTPLPDDFNEWAPDQNVTHVSVPNNCATMSVAHNYSWVLENCRATTPHYICQIGPSTTIAPTTSRTSTVITSIGRTTPSRSVSTFPPGSTVRTTPSRSAPTFPPGCAPYPELAASAEYSGTCYILSARPTDYRTYLKTDCQQFNATPVLVTNNQIHQFLVSQLKQYPQFDGKHFWIGLIHHPDHNHWVYAEESLTPLPDDFNEWAPDQNVTHVSVPNNCATMSAAHNYSWVLENCRATTPHYICQIGPSTTIAPTTTRTSTVISASTTIAPTTTRTPTVISSTVRTTPSRPVPTFPPGCAPYPELAASAEYSGTCYIFSARPTDYRAYLKTDCQQFNATPVLVTNNQIHQFLVSQLIQYPQFDGKHFWIGLLHHPDHNHWVYAEESLTPLPDYFNEWAPDQNVTHVSVPNNCATMSAAHNYSWVLEDCRATTPHYICQIGPTTTTAHITTRVTTSTVAVTSSFINTTSRKIPPSPSSTPTPLATTTAVATSKIVTSSASPSPTPLMGTNVSSPTQTPPELSTSLPTTRPRSTTKIVTQSPSPSPTPLVTTTSKPSTPLPTTRPKSTTKAITPSPSPSPTPLVTTTSKPSTPLPTTRPKSTTKAITPSPSPSITPLVTTTSKSSTPLPTTRPKSTTKTVTPSPSPSPTPLVTTTSKPSTPLPTTRPKSTTKTITPSPSPSPTPLVTTTSKPSTPLPTTRPKSATNAITPSPSPSITQLATTTFKPSTPLATTRPKSTTKTVTPSPSPSPTPLVTTTSKPSTPLPTTKPKSTTKTVTQSPSPSPTPLVTTTFKPSTPLPTTRPKSTTKTVTPSPRPSPTPLVTTTSKPSTPLPTTRPTSTTKAITTSPSPSTAPLVTTSVMATVAATAFHICSEVCHRYASCEIAISPSGNCVCDPGYLGNGTSCRPDPGSKELHFEQLLPGRQFTNALRNRTSPEFRRLAFLLKKQISTYLENSTFRDDFVGITVLEFRNGSVLADFVVHINRTSNVNESHIKDAFTQGIRNNPGSNVLSFDPADLCYKSGGETSYCSSVKQVNPTEAVPATTDQMLSGAVIAGIALAALAVVLVIAAIFTVWTRQNRRKKKYDSRLEAKNPWWENSRPTVEARSLSRRSGTSMIVNDYGFKYY